MMHALILMEGLPEAFERFEREADRHSYGKGVVRLRPVKLYDLQFPKEMEAEVKANFQLHGEFTKKNALAWETTGMNPFRHGRMQALICWAVRILGWPFGIKPATPSNKKLNPEYRPICINNLNIYPIAFVDDNVMIDKVHGTKEEFL